MRVVRWGNSLAIRIPATVAEALSLKEGDEVDVQVAGERAFDGAHDEARDRALAHLRALRRPLPPGWRFDREEANER